MAEINTESANFSQVFPTFKEFVEYYAKAQADWDRQRKESLADWDRQRQKSQADWDLWEQKQKERQEKYDAELAAQRAEQDAKLAAQKAEQDAKLAAQKAEQDAKLAKLAAQKAEQDVKIAAQKAEQEARRAELDAKIAAQKAEQEAQQKRWDQEDRERKKEMDAKLAETWAQVNKADRAVEAMSAEVDKLSKNIGGVNRTLGKLTEAMVSCNVWTKFEVFTRGFACAEQNKRFFDKGQTIAEADFFLENSIYAMPIEVKTSMDNEDVDEHLERIIKIRNYLDAHNDSRKLLGAVAGGVVPPGTVRYAQKKGLYVLLQSGDSMAIADGGAGFKAREW
jgi:hypothetical protein